jgi:methyl-accepting chemotaxis protein
MTLEPSLPGPFQQMAPANPERGVTPNGRTPMTPMSSFRGAPAPRERAPQGQMAYHRHARRRSLLLDLPIAWRLTLGFLLAALIAAAASGLSGVLRAQSLATQAAFYQRLLAANTSLTTGANFVQLMDTTSHDILQTAQEPAPSHETLTNDETALSDLATRYDSILSEYTNRYAIAQFPDAVALLTEAGHANQIAQQRTLLSSALRTWQVYQNAQNKVIAFIQAGDLNSAAALERAQAEPTNADALSALRSLIQFNSRVASSVNDAAVVEQRNQLITVAIASVLAFLAIALVGWVISNSLVQRLWRLRRVLISVEEGEAHARVQVVGRDEIARVGFSVNGMLDTIVGLLEVTRRQRDALINAAERLFADVRVAGAGDLRLNASVGGDAIGMLANAFNFTIGRFRRFVVRTQSTADQLEVVARQEYERSQNFLANVQKALGGSSALGGAPSNGISRADGASSPHDGAENALAQIYQAREALHQLAREGSATHARAVLELAEQAYLSAGRVSQLALAATQQQPSHYSEQSARLQLEELHMLGEILQRLGMEARATQHTGGERIAQIDAALDRAGSAVRDGSVRETVSAYGGSSPPSGVSGQDLGRLASTFAREVATLSRQIMVITQELRAGLTAFRIEAGAQQDPTLYPPGSGYRDGSPPASEPWSRARSSRPVAQAPQQDMRNGR